MDAEPTEIPILDHTIYSPAAAEGTRIDPYRSFKFTVSAGAGTPDEAGQIDSLVFVESENDGGAAEAADIPTDRPTFNFEEIKADYAPLSSTVGDGYFVRNDAETTADDDSAGGNTMIHEIGHWLA